MGNFYPIHITHVRQMWRLSHAGIPCVIVDRRHAGMGARALQTAFKKLLADIPVKRIFIGQEVLLLRKMVYPISANGIVFSQPAAVIIRDLITGKTNRAAGIFGFDRKRKSLLSGFDNTFGMAWNFKYLLSISTRKYQNFTHK
jgi:hypothetical protein